MVTKPNVKINLGLNVLRKREDGFHDLDTLFVPYFEISDTLEIIAGDDYSRTSAALFAKYPASAHAPQIVQAVSEDGKVMITIARAEGVDWNPLKDLTVKAYNVLAEDYELPPVKIFLEKTSPVGAGLGGGSSDAAFALRMLNELFTLGLDDQSLAGYASRLGSDCAFFIYNLPMLGQGKGEILTPYSLEGFGYGQEGAMDLPFTVKVVVPEGIAVSTAEAYRGIKPQVPQIPLSEILALPVDKWKDCLVNDFETTVFAVHPELASIKDSLYESGAVYASMSGSGSALFGIYPK
ncbi:MAG: 4-(cytidine 5'-diphospho)-2-C-methyl-D-erythritol kinase [Bacteroidales bacterium]|nr:4-(cytidine 5'-diphospho)-2-C-methyl-D-erythritol kinase [Bacteroidales bacterium]